MAFPRISVIMSVYNDEKYIAEAVESILHQTFTDFEFLIIDDYSQDRSLEILKKYKDRDSRIRLFKRENNVGLTKNLNFLLRHSKGELIARMDANDISFQDRFFQQVSMFDRDHNLSLVWTNCDYIFENEGKICTLRQPSVKKSLRLLKAFKINNIIHVSTMYKKHAVLELCNGYDESYRTGQDGDLWRRMIALNMNFSRTKATLMSVRIETSSITAVRVSRIADKNVIKAKLCFRNRSYKKLFYYIGNVKTTIDKLKLYSRFIWCWPLTYYLYSLFFLDYDKVHKNTIANDSNNSVVDEVL